MHTLCILLTKNHIHIPFIMKTKFQRKKNTRQVITPSKLHFCHFHSIYCCFSFAFRMKNHFCFILFVSYTFFCTCCCYQVLVCTFTLSFFNCFNRICMRRFFSSLPRVEQLLLQFLLSILSANKYHQRTKFYLIISRSYTSDQWFTYTLNLRYFFTYHKIHKNVFFYTVIHCLSHFLALYIM